MMLDVVWAPFHRDRDPRSFARSVIYAARLFGVARIKAQINHGITEHGTRAAEGGCNASVHRGAESGICVAHRERRTFASSRGEQRRTTRFRANGLR